MKAAWELALRRRIGLPRHNTANDGAVVLLRVSALAIVAALLALLAMHWAIGRAAAFAASAFVGLALQQYAWYTGRIYVECWSDEGIPVVAVAALAAGMISLISVLFSVLLSGFMRLLVLGAIHFGLLFSWRWVALWGSLFDVRLCTHTLTPKPIKINARRPAIHRYHVDCALCVRCPRTRRAPTSCVTIDEEM